MSMNCQEFDQIFHEVAHSQPMDARQHELALAHSAVCPSCAARLANAHSLAKGLAALATATEIHSAPSRVEDALLAAFRQQTIPTGLPEKSNVVAFPVRQSRVSLWALAAAAVLLIVFGIVAVSQWKKAPANSPTRELAIVPNPSPKPENIQPAGTQSELVVATANQSPKPVTFRKTIKASAQLDDGFLVSSSLGEFTPLVHSPNAQQEIATDFLPLTYDASDQAMESGQVIRVQIPRTALASFGLPIIPERAHETIKADLLLADDGSARAIRFIR
ncbi:MAG: hypothetical protein JNK38_09850 [Acidobacteria bacterium]|nr:hypothetical protein [Acidobacteriota bacterium]